MTRRALAVLAVAAALAMSLVAVASGVGEDPGLGQQWGVSQIAARDAWNRGLIGRGATVAVVDTGADLGHEDLKDQVAAAVTCIDTGGDPSRCERGGEDIEGHGTHVAGIAAASANRVGVSGVAPGAQLVVARVFDEVSGVGGSEYRASASDISAAIRWIIANVRVRGAINLSLGGNFAIVTIAGSGFSAAIEEAWRAGWVPVLASGNENLFDAAGSSNYGSINAVVVGATGPDGRLAPYSSPFGNAKWALVAPGGAASSCDEQPERCVLSTYRGGRYAYLQGTSMATPHVAASLAVLMGAGLSNEQAVARLLESADRRIDCGRGCDGRVDLAKATIGLGASAAPAGPVATAPPPGPARAPSGAGTTRSPATAPATTAGSSPTTDGGGAADPSGPITAIAPEPEGAGDDAAALPSGDGPATPASLASPPRSRRDPAGPDPLVAAAGTLLLAAVGAATLRVALRARGAAGR